MSKAVEMVRIACDALEDKQAEDIRIIKIDEVSIMADYLVIANGTNQSQVNALVSNVDDELSKKGFEKKRMEGSRNATWTLMDYSDVIIHIFSKEDRAFYALEQIWKHGVTISREELGE